MNTNPETNIRYSVYSMTNIDGDVANELWYGSHVTYLSEEEFYKEALEEARAEAEESGEEFDEDYWEPPECFIDEPQIEGIYQGVKYGIDWLGGAPLLWVFESPYTGTFRLGSPCIPNACNGDSPDEGGYEGYAIPTDWSRA